MNSFIMLLAMLLSLAVIDLNHGYWTANIKSLETAHQTEINSIQSNPSTYQSVYDNYYDQAKLVEIYDPREN